VCVLRAKKANEGAILWDILQHEGRGGTLHSPLNRSSVSVADEASTGSAIIKDERS